MAHTSSTELSREDRRTLLRLARDAIRHGLEEKQRLRIDPSQYDDVLSKQGACFVTLMEHGNLRGCIGTFSEQSPLHENIRRMAISAAFQDNRFEPVRHDEYPDMLTNNRLYRPWPGDFSTPEQHVPPTGLDYDWEV